MTFTRVALIVVAALAAIGTAQAAARGPAPIATPEGITLEPLGEDQGTDTSTRITKQARIAFATPNGLTLYTYAQDSIGKSTCVGACAASWPAALAPKEAKVFGDWSKIRRKDGSLQWAYRGKALYTYVKDMAPGSVGGVAAEDAPLPADWTPAVAYPLDIKLPNGIAVREVPDAAAWALVDDKNRTLYAFAGNPKKDNTAGTAWTPLAAPLLAAPVGDFGFSVRDDGIKQWTYKGEGLYTNARDLVTGRASGSDADRNFSIASVARYYMPPDVTLQNTAARGRVIATKAGMTLYRRDELTYQSGGGSSLRASRPSVGRGLGTRAGCDAACLKTWRPFTAPTNATPRGFWNVATRDDGARQWTYRGYALWTYAGDRDPGDINGHGTFDFKFGDFKVGEDPRAAIPIGTETLMGGAPGLAWLVAVP